MRFWRTYDGVPFARMINPSRTYRVLTLGKAVIAWERPPGSTEVYCPGCRTNLCADDRNFVRDTDLVYYRCIYCDARSKWNFDMPIPVYIGEWVNESREKP